MLPDLAGAGLVDFCGLSQYVAYVRCVATYAAPAQATFSRGTPPALDVAVYASHFVTSSLCMVSAIALRCGLVQDTTDARSTTIAI